jgi:hypothetical protein
VNNIPEKTLLSITQFREQNVLRISFNMERKIEKFHDLKVISSLLDDIDKKTDYQITKKKLYFLCNDKYCIFELFLLYHV